VLAGFAGHLLQSGHRRGEGPGDGAACKNP
jgi:hypothetical protein